MNQSSGDGITTEPWKAVGPSTGITSDLPETVELKWLMVVSVFLAFVGNCINIYIIPQLNDITDSNRVLYTGRSAFDLLISLLYMPCLKPAFAGYWIYPDWSCKLVGFLLVYSFGMAEVIVVMTTADRFCIIYKPLRYPTLASRKVTAIVVGIVCIFFCLIQILLYQVAGNSWDIIRFRVYGVCMVDYSVPYFAPYTLAAMSFILISAAVLIFVYAKITCIVRKHARRIAAQNNVIGRDNRLVEGMTLVRSTIIACVTSGLFMVSWIPYSVCEVMAAVTGHPVSVYALTVAARLTLCNTWFNVFVYSWLNREFRRVLLKVACRVKRRVMEQVSTSDVG
ncbi:trace amine-associated receptor 9-like [Diadema antillarum]|uniref:trace amine-associated receptor 9-like n=1 Tax=Diadema antillarum TaxID=105358 RepID=UPI003A8A635C